MRILFVSPSQQQAAPIVDPIRSTLEKRGIDWVICTDAQDIGPAFDVVYLLSWDKVIPANIVDRVAGKVVVFHSSDLPHGRGWAPIYTAIANGKAVHTISMCYAAEPVDSGNILAKARIPIAPNYTAPMLREAGRRAIGEMILRYSVRFADQARPPGAPQVGEGSYIKRRWPAEARVSANVALAELMPHLLASEAPNLAQVEYRGERFRLQVMPENASIVDELAIEESFGDGRDAT